MKQLHSTSVTIAGAGVFGLTTALRLADAGAQVTVCDPLPTGQNASGVAAGMLAPVFESVLGGQDGAHFLHLVTARDLWPGLLHRIGLAAGLDRSGAILVADPREAAALTQAQARIAALGLAPRLLSTVKLQRLLPGLSACLAEGLFAADDWRIEPAPTLAALTTALLDAGGRIVRARLEASVAGFVLVGEPVRGVVVIATGADTSGLASLAPELVHLAPVKGQILCFAAGPGTGPVVRGFGGYLAPHPGGVMAGATMEPGRRDLDLDPAALAGLRAGAARLFPHLGAAPAVGRAGIRAETPDGLPMIGRSRGGGEVTVMICAGARRNGWLLAPLAADIVLRTLTGQGAAPGGAAFDPGRFG